LLVYDYARRGYLYGRRDPSSKDPFLPKG
jgi:hypothetical protein